MPYQIQSAKPLICYNATTMMLTNTNRLQGSRPPRATVELQSAHAKTCKPNMLDMLGVCVCMYLSSNYVAVTRIGLPVCHVIMFAHSCSPCSVSAKQAMLHRCLTFSACTASVCMATLYLTWLLTSRLPAMRISCCSPANYEMIMAYACPAFCCLSAPGLQGTTHLGQSLDWPQCSNDDFVKPNLIAGY